MGDDLFSIMRDGDVCSSINLVGRRYTSPSLQRLVVVDQRCTFLAIRSGAINIGLDC